ncbi:hypothetical protein PENTCL1PPCAC_22554, partial [Pristionchus entomophagus]
CITQMGDDNGTGMGDASKAILTAETMEMDMPAHSEHNKQMLAEFDRRRRARTLTLPTDDVQVKLKLRMLNQPICLFGEEILDRRERLRAHLSNMDEEQVAAILHSDRMTQEQQEQDTETWYYRGPAGLKEARVNIADYSLRRAKTRLEKSRREAVETTQQEKALARQEAHKLVQTFQLHGSQVADSRPCPFVEFSPDGNHVVTAGWSGQPTVWKRDSGEKLVRYAGHTAQCGSARFHPGAFMSQPKTAVNVASCSHDGGVLLWSLEKETPLLELENHGNRVNRIAFHPSGKYLASACYDHSWRLFDIEVGEELLYQTGHSKSVTDVSFQGDGSLALSTGLDCYGRLWDLRTGRCIMFLDGHTREVLSGEFLPNGYLCITASADNTCRVWDVRMRRCAYTMAAHTNAVSRVRVDPGGQYVVTSSFDCSLKIWSTESWQPLRHLQGHEMKVMGVDISPDSKWIVSASFDRTFKLWTASDY